ncbi:MAG: non-canonical purine NTP diphosphatase [Bacteroidota bacterium]
MKLVFATQNPDKLREIIQKTGNSVTISGLDKFQLKEELPETGNTLTANALEKARYVAEKFHVNCFADDTGLEVEALNGDPGVFSARYAGEEKNALKNMQKLLHELKNKNNRNACFKTVIALVMDGKEYLFEGKVDGKITNEMRGEKGFGYDPVFVPDGFEKTFAEMTAEEKNNISHRAKAVEKLVEFLKSWQ